VVLAVKREMEPRKTRKNTNQEKTIVLALKELALRKGVKKKPRRDTEKTITYF